MSIDAPLETCAVWRRLKLQPALEIYLIESQWGAATQAMRTSLDGFHDLELKRPLAKTEDTERAAAVAKLAQWSHR